MYATRSGTLVKSMKAAVCILLQFLVSSLLRVCMSEMHTNATLPASDSNMRILFAQ